MKNKKNIIIGILLFVAITLITIIILLLTGVIKLKEKEVLSCDKDKIDVENKAADILEEAKKYYLENKKEIIDLTSEETNFKDASGYIVFYGENDYKYRMYINGYCVSSTSDLKMNITNKLSKLQCETKVPNKEYKNGEEVYFNPTTGTKCEQSEVKNTKLAKEGCMKWYAFLDSEENSKVKLLLDHNISANINLLDKDGNIANDGDSIVLGTLNKLTSSWVQNSNNNKTKVSARLISVDEILNILQIDTKTFDPMNKDFYIKIDKNTWLFSNDTDFAYWTDTIYYSHFGEYEDDAYKKTLSAVGYIVLNNGNVFSNEEIYTRKDDDTNYTAGKYNEKGIGIRPVIEVDKSIFK